MSAEWWSKWMFSIIFAAYLLCFLQLPVVHCDTTPEDPSSGDRNFKEGKKNRDDDKRNSNNNLMDDIQSYQFIQNLRDGLLQSARYRRARQVAAMQMHKEQGDTWTALEALSSAFGPSSRLESSSSSVDGGENNDELINAMSVMNPRSYEDEGNSTNGTCQYPCSLINGCICDHTKPTQGKDKQYYGTCTSCSTGWGGYDCRSVALSCLNGGYMEHEAGNHSRCMCPITWKGPSCGSRQCINSINGTGEHRIAPINPKNNMCDNCEEGYSGVSCNLCSKDSQCGKDTTCNTSLVASGHEKTFLCTITGKQWTWLLGNGRPVTGYINLVCDKPSGFNVSTQDGACYLTVFRKEPNGVWMDPFFYGTLQNCSMDVGTGTTQATTPPTEPEAARIVRLVLSIILWVCCGLLTLYGFMQNPKVAQYVRKILTKCHIPQQSKRLNKESLIHYTALGVVVCLIAFILFSVFFGHEPTTKPSQIVRYNCLHSKCECAPDPWNKSWDPQCIGSIMGMYFLPRLLGASHLECDYDTAACKYVHTDLGNTPIEVTCKAAECVPKNESGAVYFVDNGDVPQSAAIIMFSLIGVLIVLLFIHYWYHKLRAKSRDREFRMNNMDVQSALGGPVVPNKDLAWGGDEKVRESDGVGHSAGTDDVRSASTAGYIGGAPSRAPPASSSPTRSSHPNPQTGSGSAAHLATPLIPASSSSRDSTGSAEGGEACVLTCHNIYYSVPSSSAGGTAEILQDINVTVMSGETLAIMGPSGAGKTTVLDILAGREKVGTLQGNICVNGEPITRSNANLYKRIRGYVAQEDNLIPALTVRQSIYFAAKLKLPSGIPDEILQELVEDILLRLQLTQCANTLVGDESTRGISGGEKRRVSIATELVANPRILFLDEPTSGLDSVSALEVMKAIVHLTQEPIVSRCKSFFGFRPCVIFSIHQPSTEIFGMFNRVLLLSHGHAYYFGPASCALEHVTLVRTTELPPAKTKPPNTVSTVTSTMKEHHKKTASGNGGAGPYGGCSLGEELDSSNRLQERLELWEAQRVRLLSTGSSADEKASSQQHVVLNLPQGTNPAEVLLRAQHEATPEEWERMIKYPSPIVQTRHNELLFRKYCSVNYQAAEGLPPGEKFTGEGGPSSSHSYTVLQSPNSPFDRYIPSSTSLFSVTMKHQVYFPNAWQQFKTLARRTYAALMGSYYLVASHSAAALFLGTVLINLYHAEQLDLKGTENKAGMVTFLLLVVAFSSLSCLELFIAEKKLFLLERENGYYTTMPYFANKVLFDYLPLRVVPTLCIGAVIYFPMGLRTDTAMHFIWFIYIMVVFSLYVTGTCFCVAMLSDSFGAAALFSSLIILWNTAFGGLMIQAQTIPPGFEPFKYLSPFYYAFEALMCNELDGLHCVFDPANSEGQSANVIVPILCRQFLYNLGLEPKNFKQDVVLLTFGVLFFLLVAYCLLRFFVRLRK